MIMMTADALVVAVSANLLLCEAVFLCPNPHPYSDMRSGS